MTSVTTSFESKALEARGHELISEPRTGERSGTNLSEEERYASIVGGGALLTYGLFRRSLPLMALGSYLAYRGKRGRCNLYHALGINSAIGEEGRVSAFSRTITINRSREEVYRLFKGDDHGFGPLRGFVRAESDGGGAASWSVRPAESLPLRWDVELIQDRESEKIVWQTPAESRVRLRYELELDEAPRERGTRVRVNASWLLPGGGPGAVAGKALGAMVENQLDASLRRAKQYLETGEIATTEGQPSGRSRVQRWSDKAHRLSEKVVRLVS